MVRERERERERGGGNYWGGCRIIYTDREIDGYIDDDRTIESEREKVRYLEEQ